MKLSQLFLVSLGIVVLSSSPIFAEDSDCEKKCRDSFPAQATDVSYKSFIFDEFIGSKYSAVAILSSITGIMWFVKQLM